MKIVLASISIVLFLMGFPPNAQAFPHAETTAVWNHHIEAWNARDLAAITADYDERSILIVNNKIYRGPAEIGPVFARLFEIFDGGHNMIDPPTLDGRIVFITWNFTPSSNEGHAFDGTDTFVIEEGKIRVQTIASRLYLEFPLP